MRSVYLAHPVAGDIGGNYARARRWARWIYRHNVDVVVIAPWMLEIDVLGADDRDPAAREAALRRCVVVARLCDEIWLVGGRITEGMQREADAARSVGHAVRDLTELGPEAPECIC